MGTHLSIVLSNGTPVVDFSGTVGHSTPFELSVLPLNSPQAVLSADIYMQSFNYLFRGLSNFSSGKIGRVAAEKSWFGRIEKNMDKIEWNAITEKSLVVVYDISRDEIAEHYYVADAISYKKGRHRKATPVWNERLIKPSAKTMKEGLITAIEIATEFTSEYRLIWGYKGKRGLFILDRNDKKVDIKDINDDETYILFQLLLLLASKELHVGVFCINAQDMSDKLINSMVQASKSCFGDGFIFIKHLDASSKIERQLLSLPVL